MTKSDLRFQMVSPFHIQVVRDNKVIGDIWSQDAGTLPYPHQDTEYCKNSIQVCGFDNVSPVWSCGRFPYHKDLVVNFEKRR